MGEPIHSGHFMKSRVHESELADRDSSSEDDDVVVDVLTSDAAGGSILPRKSSAGAPGTAAISVVTTAGVAEPHGQQALGAEPGGAQSMCYTAQQSALVASLEKPVTFYKFGKNSARSIAIDVSLGQLKKCISTAYSRLTTPKWKDFKGVRLNWKQRIRLNNVIWRAWHMEFGSRSAKGKARYCYFSIPDTDAHCKIEGSVVEGMYWKRRFEIVCAQYRHWRSNRCQRHKLRHRSSGTGHHGSAGRLPHAAVGQLDWIQQRGDVLSEGRAKCINSGDHGHFVLPGAPVIAAGSSSADASGSSLCPPSCAPGGGNWSGGSAQQRSLTPQFSLAGLEQDDLANDFTDRLFDSLLQPYMFPDAREFAHGVSGNADCIQPGLSALQPSLEEIISGFDDESHECCAAGAEHGCSPRTPPSSGLSQRPGRPAAASTLAVPHATVPAADKNMDSLVDARAPGGQAPVSYTDSVPVPHSQSSPLPQPVPPQSEARTHGGGRANRIPQIIVSPVSVSACAPGEANFATGATQRVLGRHAQSTNVQKSAPSVPPVPTCSPVYSEREYSAAAMLARLQKRKLAPDHGAISAAQHIAASTAAHCANASMHDMQSSSTVFLPPPLYSQARYSHSLFAEAQPAPEQITLTSNHNVCGVSAPCGGVPSPMRSMQRLVHGADSMSSAFVSSETARSNGTGEGAGFVQPSTCNLLGTIASMQSPVGSAAAAAHLQALLSPRSVHALSTQPELDLSAWSTRVSLATLQQHMPPVCEHPRRSAPDMQQQFHMSAILPQVTPANPLPDLPLSPVPCKSAKRGAPLDSIPVVQSPAEVNSEVDVKRRRTNRGTRTAMFEAAVPTSQARRKNAICTTGADSMGVRTGPRPLAPKRAPADSSTSWQPAKQDALPLATGAQLAAHHSPLQIKPEARSRAGVPRGGDRRRAAHVHAEASRREALKDGLDRLTASLESTQGHQPLVRAKGTKVTNALLLANAAEFIRSARATSQASSARELSLRTTIDELNQRVRSAQSSLPSSGCGTVLNNGGADSGPGTAAAAVESARQQLKLWQLFAPLMSDFMNDVIAPTAGQPVQSGIDAVGNWAKRECTVARLRPVASKLLVKLATESPILAQPNCFGDYVKEEMDKMG